MLLAYYCLQIKPKPPKPHPIQKIFRPASLLNKGKPETPLFRSFWLFYQFLKLWIGAGILPPRLMKSSQENLFTGMIGA